jgi:hypothetical protein
MPKLNKMSVTLMFFMITILSGIPAYSEENNCTIIAGPKDRIEAKHGQWKLLTTDQWEFLRGVYVVNPNTAPGMPKGDRAVLAQIDGTEGGQVFFIDGPLACSPMAVPAELIRILNQVGAGADVDHVGDKL